MTAVLIVGSYPPIPVAGAPVTVGEVRRAWAAGEEVTVVAPRLGAAHLTVPIAGPLAGRRLDNVRRHTGARRLVMVVERGFPLAGDPVVQLVSAAALSRAMRGFDHVRLVRAGALDEVSPRAWALLSGGADEVVQADGGPSAAGVTPLGPPEVPWTEQPRRLAGIAARRALGPRAPVVRAKLAALKARLRPAR